MRALDQLRSFSLGLSLEAKLIFMVRVPVRVPVPNCNSVQDDTDVLCEYDAQDACAKTKEGE